MNKNKQAQEPATVNQIENERSSLKKSLTLLTGNIANSMNGGHNRTIAFKKVMAGERHNEYRMQLKIQMLTPLTPAYQDLKCTIRTYFVPNSRVWNNAEKYTAQKGGTTEEKIEEIPNLGGKQMPILMMYDDSLTPEEQKYKEIQHTTAWRNAWVSSYIPRIGFNKTYSYNELTNKTAMYMNILPKISVLPLRGRMAIYNDFERNKEYDPPMFEYKTDNVTDAEWKKYLPLYNQSPDLHNMRARRNNSYYTDYRTEYQGFESTAPELQENSSLITWSDWESKIAEARQQAENAQKNDWQIIAEMRGSKLLTQGKVQLIGKKTFNLNYAAITQTAYNTNENIQEEFQVMGKQGAYSYTEVDIPCYAGFEAQEEGYIHIIATVTADTVFESAFDRNELNVKPLDEYRPDLINEKFDILMASENGTTRNYGNNIEKYTEAIGFKRKFSEYFKLPNIIAGDMTSLYYEETTPIEGRANYFISGRDNVNEIITQKTFQFFETDRNYEAKSIGDDRTAQKKIWRDYTDLMINKNQAIENPIIEIPETQTGEGGYYIQGQQQIFFVGKCYLVAELPIDEAIKNNYTQWGEH